MSEPTDAPPVEGPPPPPPPPYPPGTPEYDAWAAEDQGPTILILCWFFVALATVFMIGRLYARLSLFKQLKSDDYWCLASLFFAYMASSFVSEAVDNGHGRHVQTLTQHQAEQVRLWTFAAFMPGVLVLGLPKVAVVTLLIRLLNPSKWHRYFLLGMVTWCVLSNIATIGTLAGQCTPTRAMWNFDIVPDCINPDHVVNFSLYSGSLNAFVDIYLAIYPAIVLFKLQMRMRKKVVLSMALGIGVVGGIVAIYKTTRLPTALKSQDFSYDSGGLVYWSIIEASTTIIAATIPTLSPLMEKLFKGRNPFASFKRSSKGDSNGGSKGFTWKGSKDISKKSSEKHASLPYPQAAYMDPYSPRRKTHDPDSLSMDLGETIVGDSSEENFMPIQKTTSSKADSEFHRASGSTDVPPQHSPMVQHSPFVLGGDLEAQDGAFDNRRVSDTTDVEHHAVAGNLESHPSYGSSSSDDSMDVAPQEQRHNHVTADEPHNSYNPFHSSRGTDWPLSPQQQQPTHGITRTSEVSVSYSSPRTSSQRSPPPRISSPWTSVQ